MDRRIYFICNYIAENLHEKHSAGHLAEKVYLSTSHFITLFKKEIGSSPIRYILNLRLDTAQKLLDEENFLSIKEIGLKVGFNDQSHFIQEFKSKFGITPKLYRQEKWLKIIRNQPEKLDKLFK